MNEVSPIVRVRAIVPFHDCDPLQVVWHGRYLEYFELARTELFQDRGVDIPRIRDLGFRMYVADARCRYMFPLTYGDEMEVTAKAVAWKPMLRIVYSIRNLTKSRRSARGFTALATTDSSGRLLPETPNAIMERIFI
ncbi:MAG TPA: acyl-CoA thioesterase [Myxococcales bacterium]|nr:acyl-CoA thioesterase [Myxococcales bacterium]HIM00221.1 acyl-CoA thioesterase [Myxococcales bacterium]